MWIYILNKWQITKIIKNLEVLYSIHEIPLMWLSPGNLKFHWCGMKLLLPLKSLFSLLRILASGHVNKAQGREEKAVISVFGFVSCIYILEFPEVSSTYSITYEGICIWGYGEDLLHISLSNEMQGLMRNQSAFFPGLFACWFGCFFASIQSFGCCFDWRTSLHSSKFMSHFSSLTCHVIFWRFYNNTFSSIESYWVIYL